MKILFFLIALFAMLNVEAQSPGIDWQQSLGGSSTDNANCVRQTSDGGYIIAGSSNSTDGDVSGNHGDADYWIVKLSSAGSIEWQQSLGGSNFEYAFSIAETASGQYVVAGYTYSSNGDVTGFHGSNDYWIVKLSVSGAIIWQKCFGGAFYEGTQSFQQTTDGGFIIAGGSNSSDGDVTANYGNADYWIIKLDTAGSIVWQKNFGGSDYEGAYSVQQTSDGGYIIAGNSSSTNGDITVNHGNNDIWIIKLNSSGSLLWQKSFGGSADDYAYSIKQTSDGGYIVAGSSNSTDGDITASHGNDDAWMIRLNASGNLIWQKCFGGSQNDYAYSVSQTNDGGYIMAGYTESTDGDVSGNHGFSDYWIIKMDTAGSLVWQKCLGGSTNDEARSVEQTSDGGYIVAGGAYSTDGDATINHGSRDVWIVKLLPDPIGFDDSETTKIHIYPNPAVDEIFIETSSEQQQLLSVINSQGQLLKQTEFSGSKISVDVSHLCAGVYFIRIQSDSAVRTLKFMK